MKAMLDPRMVATRSQLFWAEDKVEDEDVLESAAASGRVMAS
jgi:hypothetical protein